MKANFLVVAAMLVALSLGLLGVKERAGADAESRDPKFVQGNELTRPEGYREWIYLSSGLGMNYSARSQPGEPQFTNVFVTPEAYRQFMRSATWPERTVFVLEERDSSTKGSINKGGHFQTKLTGLVAEVKDGERFPEKWAFFSFTDAQGNLQDTAKALPKSACWSCHNSHGAVDNTFVQFYPTLREVAHSKGTFREESPKEGNK
jgi:hypothetical protein